MSSNSRVTRGKGESDGLSLPARTRQRKKSTNMENDGNTALNTTFNTGLDQHHPQMPVHTSPLPAQPPRPTSTQSVTRPIIGDRQPSTTLVTDDSGNRCQSTPPQADIVKMQETPVPAVPPTQQRPFPFLHHNTLVHTCHKCPPLFLQKTDTVDTLMMT